MRQVAAAAGVKDQENREKRSHCVTEKERTHFYNPTHQNDKPKSWQRLLCIALIKKKVSSGGNTACAAAEKVRPFHAVCTSQRILSCLARYLGNAQGNTFHT